MREAGEKTSKGGHPAALECAGAKTAPPWTYDVTSAPAAKQRHSRYPQFTRERLNRRFEPRVDQFDLAQFDLAQDTMRIPKAGFSPPMFPGASRFDELDARNTSVIPTRQSTSGS